MNLIQTINLNQTQPLQLTLDGEAIIITKLGTYENRTWFSWVSWGPTEHSEPFYKSSLITEDDIFKRISLLTNGKILKHDDNLTINDFLER
jgi:hypothetical protein